MAILGPFSVGYPVAFRSGGDTTREAFGKHIQEIEKIYGILNALDADKLSAADLNRILSGFTPNMSFSDITGNLDLSRTTGNLDGSRITGRIDASKVYGRLSNATIDTSNVNGLQAFVQGLIPPSTGGTGDGITTLEANENGYAEFGNGLIIEWGKSDTPMKTVTSGGFSSGYQLAEGDYEVNFVKEFPNKCLHVEQTVRWDANYSQAKVVMHVLGGSITKKGYHYALRYYEGTAPTLLTDTMRVGVNYVAIGK